ncbi:MAG TPA: Wzz/FepE/Etk N-terminal domain-containing protein, partial [Terriglobales bacterium]|nr:Wzz/FepE/Etk N-terminal domain-containing protein [Terriglobales bacterium]
MDKPLLPSAHTQLGPSGRCDAYPESAVASAYVHQRPDAFESGALLEYWQTLRAHKAVVVLISLVGMVTGVLLTLPQTPVYRARTVLELQDLNDNFLNIKQISPVSAGET